MILIRLKRVLIKIIQSRIQHYDHEKYWHRRSIVVNPNDHTNIIVKLWYLFYIKRCDAWNNASFGTNLNKGAQFQTPPTLWHGLNGIIIGYDVTVGKNAIISQRVTITHGEDV